MNSSDYSDEPRLTECSDGLVDPQEVLVRKVEIFHAETYEQSANEHTVDTRTSRNVNELEETWASSSAEENEVRLFTSPNSTRLEYEAERSSPVNSAQFESEARSNWTSPVNSQYETKDNGTPPNSSQFENGARDRWSSPINSAQLESEARNNWTSPVNSQYETKDNGTPPNSSQFENGARDSWSSPVNSAQFENRESWTSPISNQESDQWKDSQASLTGSEVSVQREEKWSDTLTSPPGFADDTLTSDTAPPCEQISEMYYTASSEVSLLSDTEIPEKVKEEVQDQEEGKECVIAGHVAAMRERFESMTRANTPCPELLRSSSPSLDVFRNVTPSPDRLG